MSDFAIFVVGCFVTGLVGSAVSLLLLGASRAPRRVAQPSSTVERTTLRPSSEREWERLAG